VAGTAHHPTLDAQFCKESYSIFKMLCNSPFHSVAIENVLFMHYTPFIALYLKGTGTPLYVALFSKNSSQLHMNAQPKEKFTISCCAVPQQIEQK